MNLTSKELKRRARETLSGHYGLPMGAFVVTELIIVAMNFPFQLSLQHNPNNFQLTVYSLASVIISLLSIVLSCGLTCIHLNLARNKEVKFTDLFRFFTRRPDRFILAGLMLMGILILIMIPGFVVTVAAVLFDSVLWYALMTVIWIATIVVLFVISYSYGLIYYLMIDHPDMKLIPIFRESRHKMKGHKGRMFYISFSFIGLSLLCLLSLGIGYLWVGPYMNQTNVEFYRNVIGEI